ncbi:ribosome-dependent ATPase [Constrictibacter sp. MBR-5]|jgi:ribosome-dependent ATPase|uniref:ribosome-associated ATPase/putative transporter RbbA n=1 Tax=Constrictibacter sp. MBR-5 TaxID=3156467 RepID=UPI00339138AE
MTDIAVDLQGVGQRYGRTVALEDVSLSVRTGEAMALVGPDGVGKSTLMALIAGARRRQTGRIGVLGGDMADTGHRTAVCERIAYMPQGLGRNLYMELSVAENLHFFGRLFGQGRPERRARVAELLQATGLASFADRPAGKLSGGMKQKLGLCCALIHDPDLLLLDEPTTGVDPLSRRQFWELIEGIRRERPGMTVIVTTAYMDEAQRFGRIVAMNGGRILADGSPTDLLERTGAADIEAAFVALLPAEQRDGHRAVVLPPRPETDSPPAIVADHLTLRFGSFTAVDDVSFEIPRGEIFGFLGSNGCGKTTTMKMLTGLLPPTKGSVQLFGRDASPNDMTARRRVGYMSQSFSLYGELSVLQNLDLHGRLFSVPDDRLRARIDELLDRFGLRPYRDQGAGDLPLGVRQRLSLAVAVIHEPELLILDEPTSGVDPVARDRFWELLIELSREHGVTIFISTHFMNEAGRCDRISLMHAGRVLASGTPEQIRSRSRAHSLEEAFIEALEDAAEAAPSEEPTPAPAAAPAAERVVSNQSPGAFSPGRLWAYTLRESMEILRDPIRLSFAFLGTALLLLVLGFGISFDVEDLRFAALDRDRTPESRTYLEAYSASRYFTRQPPLDSHAEMDRRMQAGDITLAVEIPPGFGRDLTRGANPEVSVWVDGAMPFRAETVRGYVEGLHQAYLTDLARRTRGEVPATGAVTVEARYRYNQAFLSTNAMVPASIAILLVFIPAILTALGVVRERELGSITNLYVTPTTRLEFLLGKQLPYIAIGMANFAAMTLMALFVFDVPVKGSLIALSLGALLYVAATTGIGLVISTFTRSQLAALFGTAIGTMLPATQFSGMTQPVSTLEGSAALIGQVFPTSYFMSVSVGAFTKALGLVDLIPELLALAVFFPVLAIASALLLPKQER